MEQALHIFRKDVRHLWPRIVAVLLLMMAHAYFETRRLPISLPGRRNTNGISTTLDMLLPLGIWFLIAWVVFQETLPGDRQFWLTRPYRGRSYLRRRCSSSACSSASPYSYPIAIPWRHRVFR